MNKFKKEGWSLTDPDTLQFAIALQDDVWRYKQFRFDLKMNPVSDLDEFVDIVWNVKQCWNEADIDINDYTFDEIEEYINLYGYTGNQHIKSSIHSYIKDVYSEEWKQIIAECIFEQEIFNN